MDWAVEKVAGPYAGEAHGLIWDGEAILFSLVAASRIMRYHPGTGRVAEYRKYTCGTRGLAFDLEGRLYGCQSSARRIVRFNGDGSTSMLADRIERRLHNQPYNLAIDRSGRIWFTDPEPAARVMEPPVDHASVLRLEHDAEGKWVLRRMTFDTTFPVGVALSPDQRSIYVSDNPRDGAENSELRSYALLPDDSLAPPQLMQSFPAGCGVKGMCLDAAGNVVACLGAEKDGGTAAVAVLSPDGRILRRYPFGPGEPTNCAFGDRELTTLYMTSSDGCLYRAERFLQGR